MSAAPPRLAWPLLLVLPLLVGRVARADREPPTAPPPAPEEAAPAEPVVARVVGDHVNLRVGPRVDSRAVAQLDEGTVVLVVERLGDWVGVHVPQGFPAAISGQYVEEDGPDAVKVTTANVNLRVHPPEVGGPPGAPFRDRPERGAVLTMLSREGEWYWVLAPEPVRAYLHSRFVEDVGPLSTNGEGVEAARAQRARQVEMLSTARRAQVAEAAGMRLRQAMGEIQSLLYRHRLEGGTDKTPVVILAQRLDQATEEAALAPPRVLVVAKALREDLEAEIAFTAARRDAEVARTRGEKGAPPPTPAPRLESVDVVGEVRYEPTPGWRDGGIYLLWIDDAPRYALRLTTGGDLPHPDFKACTDGQSRRVLGAQPGERLLGFPVIDVKSVRMP